VCDPSRGISCSSRRQAGEVGRIDGSRARCSVFEEQEFFVIGIRRALARDRDNKAPSGDLQGSGPLAQLVRARP
jgi:hypothetical protein